MKIIALITASLLAVTTATAQIPSVAPVGEAVLRAPTVPDASTLLQRQPAFARDSLSVRSQAPRRARMNLSLNTQSPIYNAFEAGNLYTFSEVVPIEAAAYAAKIAIANPFAGLYHINSASVYFSDSYSGYMYNGSPYISFGPTSAGMPTINSVFQKCTSTVNSATLVCSDTSVLPSGSTMYVIGPGLNNNVANVGTVASGTNITLNVNALAAAGTYTYQFANIAPECKMYWDYGGADVDTINTSGTKRDFGTYGPSANTLTNGTYQFTYQWSDFVPCSSVPRADGGTQPIAFIFITLAADSQHFTEGLFNSGSGTALLDQYNTNVAPILGNRYMFSSRSFAGAGNDYADNPAGTSWVYGIITPMIELSYLTDAPGWNLMQTGDSITAAPTTGMGNSAFRSCKRLSTLTAPCEWSSVAYGGTATPVYDESLRNNIASINPSAIIMQPLSRNDGVTASVYNTLLAKILSYGFQSDAKLGYYGSFPFTNTIDGNAQEIADYAAQRSKLAAASRFCNPASSISTCAMIPFFDTSPYLSRALLGGNFYDYLALNSVTTGAVAAGGTSIPVNQTVPCYAGDMIQDVTTPAVITPGATVISVGGSAIVVNNRTVIGAGIASGDTLQCSFPGWNGLGLTEDNTHPNYNAVLLIQPASDVFIRQLLGIE